MKMVRAIYLFAFLFSVLFFFRPGECPAEEEASTSEWRVRFLLGIDVKVSGTAISDISAMAVDNKNKEIYLVDRGNARVVIAGLDGTFQFDFSFMEAGIADIGAPFDIAVSEDGMIYMAGEGGVVVVNYNGKFLRRMDFSRVPGPVLIHSIEIEGDYIYVGDKEGRRIIIMNRRTDALVKEIKTSIGRNFILAVGTDYIYRLDPGFYTVYRYDREGKFLGQFGRMSELAGGFSMPAEIAVDRARGFVYVTDVNRFAVIIFDRDGNYIRELAGEGTTPRYIAVDDYGRFYIMGAGGVVSVYLLYEEKIPVYPVRENKAAPSPPPADKGGPAPQAPPAPAAGEGGK